MARTERFDLYLLDNWLPRMSGHKLCGRLREFDTVTPVLFFSSGGKDYKL